MATDNIFHRFWVELDSILDCFLGLKSEKWIQKNTAKTDLQKSRARNPDQSQEIWQNPLWSFKTTCPRIQGSQIPGLGTQIPGLGTYQGIMDTPLVPAGTVADLLTSGAQAIKSSNHQNLYIVVFKRPMNRHVEKHM